MKKLIGTVSIFILATTLVSCGWIQGRGKKEGAAEKRVEVARTGDFQKVISATGNLEALIDVEVKANVAGEIIKLYVDDGHYVEKDQILLEIDPEQYIEERKQAEADVDAAQAQLMLPTGVERARNRARQHQRGLPSPRDAAERRMDRVDRRRFPVLPGGHHRRGGTGDGGDRRRTPRRRPRARRSRDPFPRDLSQRWSHHP